MSWTTTPSIGLGKHASKGDYTVVVGEQPSSAVSLVPDYTTAIGYNSTNGWKPSIVSRESGHASTILGSDLSCPSNKSVIAGSEYRAGSVVTTATVALGNAVGGNVAHLDTSILIGHKPGAGLSTDSKLPMWTQGVDAVTGAVTYTMEDSAMSSAVLIGHGAGSVRTPRVNANNRQVYVGKNAGSEMGDFSSVAMGSNAGDGGRSYSYAVGKDSVNGDAYNCCGIGARSIGVKANYTVALGTNTLATASGATTTAVLVEPSARDRAAMTVDLTSDTVTKSLAVGHGAGAIGARAVVTLVGAEAGKLGAENAVCIGARAGRLNCKRSVVIGTNAGTVDAVDQIVIGNGAVAGKPYSVILESMPSPSTTARVAAGVFVHPIEEFATAPVPARCRPLEYDPVTGEWVYIP